MHERSKNSEETRRNELATQFIGGKVFLCSGVNDVTGKSPTDPFCSWSLQWSWLLDEEVSAGLAVNSSNESVSLTAAKWYRLGTSQSLIQLPACCRMYLILRKLSLSALSKAENL